MSTRTKSAFTIIEVLLAAVLLAVGLFTLLSLANRCILTGGDIFNRQLSIRLADEAMIALDGQEITVPNQGQLILTGNFENRYKNLSWQATVAKTDNDRILRVVVNVLISGKIASDFSVTSYILR